MSKVDFLMINADGAIEVVVREGRQKYTAAITRSMGEARRIVRSLAENMDLTKTAQRQLKGTEPLYKVAV